MGQILSDIFGENHLVLPNPELRRPLIIMVVIVITLVLLLCLGPLCASRNRNRDSNEMDSQQNDEARGAILQTIEDFKQYNADANPGASTDVPPIINHHNLRDNDPEPPSYNNPILINNEGDDETNGSSSLYATIRPRSDDSFRLPRLIEFACAKRGASNSEGPLSVSTIKEHKKKVVSFSNRTVAEPSNVPPQCSYDQLANDELNDEELDYNLFRLDQVAGIDDQCSESRVNAAYDRESVIDEPFIPPIDYSDDENTIAYEGNMARSDYFVDGAEESSRRISSTDDEFDDAVEEAIGTLDEVLAEASRSTAVAKDLSKKAENNQSDGGTGGGVKMLKLIPKH